MVKRALVKGKAMKFDNAILYMPCPCGSGAKFKFCCRPKLQGELDGCRTRADVVKEVRCHQAGVYAATENAEVADLCDEGFDAMRRRKFDAARDCYRRARGLDARAMTAWNNGAVCEWESGEVEAAVELQRESFGHVPCRNTFGMASMAIYLHVLGRDEEASGWLEKALEDRLPLSRDVVVRVCMALAMYRRHRDIVEYAAASCMDDDGWVALFQGIALANLGERGRASSVLRAAAANGEPTGLAEHYADCLEEGIEPRSVREGAWPYFTFGAYAPARWFDKAMEDGRDPFGRYPAVAAEAMEVLAGSEVRSPGELLALLEGKEGEPWEELRKGLERLSAEDEEEDMASTGEIREVEDEMRRFVMKVPKWQMDLDITDATSAEDDAEYVIRKFVRPYCDRYCLFPEEERDKDRLAILVIPLQSRPELSICPTVELVGHAQLWDAFYDKLVEFFENVSSDSCLCEVRCDMMFGGPYLTLKDGDSTEAFAVAVVDRYGEEDGGR